MSRQHVQFTPLAHEAGFAVVALGSNGCELRFHDGSPARVLRPSSESCATMRPNDEICMLPGVHQFRLEEDIATESTQRIEARAEDPTAPKRLRVSSPPSMAEPSEHCNSSLGGAGGGGVPADVDQAEPADVDQAEPADVDQAEPASGGAKADEDWLALSLPPFTQPPKPGPTGGPPSLSALQELALRPEAYPDKTFLLTQEFVVAYDVYPKGRVHLLLLPRVRLDGPQDLTSAHAPMVHKMARLAQWLATQLRRQRPDVAPFAVGFHAVPSMRQLHLHLISVDLQSDALKNKKHFNSFATDFFIPPTRWATDLERSGRVHTDGHAAEEEKLKRDMRCPLSGVPLKNMPAVKQHLASAAYARELAEHAAGADLVATWPR